MDAQSWSPVALVAQGTLNRLPELMPLVRAAIRATSGSYVHVPDESLTATAERNLQSLLTSLRDRRLLDTTEQAVFVSTVEERARNGVVLDEYLAAVGAAEATVWDDMWSRAEGVPDPLRHEAFTLRFANVGLITRLTATAHRQIELQNARDDQERRAVAFQELLRGGLGAPTAVSYLDRLGLEPDRNYYVVVARPREPMTGEAVRRYLGARPDRQSPAAFVTWGEDTIALLSERPVSAPGLTVAVAGPVDVNRIPEAHEQAALAFATAWALNRVGVVDLRQLGVLSAIQAAPEVGIILRDRYVAPLAAGGHLGQELLTTVRAFLECKGRRDETARRLHLHQNTVAYRLQRFADLTGADLTELSTLADLHWLFVDQDLRGPGRPWMSNAEKSPIPSRSSTQ